MKEAFLLIMALLLGFFSSHGFGYNIQPQDTSLLNRVKASVDTISFQNPAELVSIQTKLRISLRNLPEDSRASVVLTQLATYIAGKAIPTTPLGISNSTADGILRAQAALFTP